MKKTLIALFITLIFSNSAFAISKVQWNALYKNCYSQKDGMTTKFWKAYCKCNANKYDANFSEQEYAKWEKTVGNSTSNPTVVKFARQCYDKHK
jgi:hypothetical protein